MYTLIKSQVGQDVKFLLNVDELITDYLEKTFSWRSRMVYS